MAMTLKEFGMVFTVLCEYFGAKPSDPLAQIYFEAFQNWPIIEFKSACQRIIETRVYPGLPKIAEIREVIEGKIEDRVQVAYQTLMETLRHYAFWDSVVFEDGAIGHTVEDMGGWQRVSEFTVEDWQFRRKEFEQLYQAHLKRGNTDSVHLTGLFEQDNAAKGLIDHVPQPKVIEDKAKHLVLERKKIASN
jgi:hypothetical protein